MMGFIRHLTLKFDTKKALLLQQRFRSLFRRLNISLIGCSPAEPISVSIQYRKFTKNKLTQFIEYPQSELKKSALRFTQGEAVAAVNSLSNIELAKYKPLFKNFNNKTGYAVKDGINNSMLIQSDGTIWFGCGDDKLMHFDPKAVNFNPAAPIAVVQKIRINEKDICFYDLSPPRPSGTPPDGGRTNALDSAIIAQQEIMTYGKALSVSEREAMQKEFSGIMFDGITKFYPLPEQLVLPYEHNNVSFEFNAIEPAKPFMVNYQYMLEGYDKDWSPVLQKTSATFGNISEGTYTFKLKAQSPEGVWCEPITYTFKVLPPWYRTWWMYLSYTVFSLTVLWLVYKWRVAALEKEKQLLEEKVELRTVQLKEKTEVAIKNETEAFRQKEIADSQRIIAEEQRSIVEEQKILVEEKQKEILDSIHYAKRIQTALLTSDAYISEHLTTDPASIAGIGSAREHFVLFKPKDIVSGDFYWALQHKNKFYIATCDCTGHGVPGAFMSMLNISFLNEVILERGITEPHEILNHVRSEIVSALNPKGSKEESKDGMDAVLCCFDFDTMQLHFAAANNPLWLLRNGVITEYKADKMPVGKYSDEMKPFRLQTIALEKNDIIYTITDGYADQFGGPLGKKFKYKPLMDGLLSNCHKPMLQQKELLSTAFDTWKGNVEQVDDVCVIGVKI